MATAIASLTSFSTGTAALAAEVNANFAAIRTPVNADVLWLTKTGQTMTQTMTWSAAQTFSAAPVCSAGISVTGAITMATAASVIVPGATSLSLRNNADNADNLILTNAGAATFRSTVGGITTLSCTTVTATNLGGTVTTAAQASITSLGTLTALTIGGNLTFTGANRTIVPGTTSLSIRNVGDTVAVLSVSASGIAIGTGTGMSTQIGVGILTTATAGHLLLPNCPGTPTGAVSDDNFVYDNSNAKLYVRHGGTWKSVTFA